MTSNDPLGSVVNESREVHPGQHLRRAFVGFVALAAIAGMTWLVVRYSHIVSLVVLGATAVITAYIIGMYVETVIRDAE